MAVNSNAKGKRGEREWRDKLRKRGLSARRGQQFKGTTDSPDVVCDEMPDHYAEVKRDSQLNIHKVLTQAAKEADGLTPYVAHRKDRENWKVTMWGDDWLDMVERLIGHCEQKHGQRRLIG